MTTYARIADDVEFGEDVQIHEFVNLYGCRIGDRTKVGPFVEVQKNAIVGSDCKISSHSFICEGVRIGDDVFVGHNVTFINDPYPRATNAGGQLQNEEDWDVVPTIVEDGASIGSSATLLCGITIGARSIVGAGSMVTKSVGQDEIWAGNPARFLRKMDVS